MANVIGAAVAMDAVVAPRDGSPPPWGQSIPPRLFVRFHKHITRPHNAVYAQGFLNLSRWRQHFILLWYEAAQSEASTHQAFWQQVKRELWCSSGCGRSLLSLRGRSRSSERRYRAVANVYHMAHRTAASPTSSSPAPITSSPEIIYIHMGNQTSLSLPATAPEQPDLHQPVLPILLD